jgi:hypothetical protein
MRLIIICSQLFRGLEKEASKASLDLLKYYESLSTTVEINWDFSVHSVITIFVTC